ncbi:13778_t:CDS:2 [Racocetra persica]|uniref:13778_t:CDS:1 n=1 Tax=Racocetra persica TaxID=160502 RepID=A0ACA9R9W3_9GLOM|nr:13778_t:CDS:2 [Racocetra persica]
MTLDDHETQILYELQGILHAIDAVLSRVFTNRTLTNLIQLTSSGGKLDESQRTAKIGIEELKKIIESKNDDDKQ